MSPSYDVHSSIFLCAEDNASALGYDDYLDDDDEETRGGLGLVLGRERSDLYGDFLMDFPLPSDEQVSLLVEKEMEHLPRGDYPERLKSGALDLSIRSDAIDWICKVHGHLNYGPLSAYLSVNYLDRFLGDYQLPQGKAWMTQLLSVACLSLAAKMEETLVPSILDLQIGSSKFVFEAKTIQRMELLVLNTLKWRMQPVTPFTFIDFFLHKFNRSNSPDRSLISRSAEFILSTMKGTEFLTFRPSEVAAATALVVLGGREPMDIKNSLSCCVPLAKLQEGVLKCYEMLHDMKLTINRQAESGNTSVASMPYSPVCVLDASSLSCMSSAAAAVGSHAICLPSTPDAKRRKVCSSVLY